MDFNKEKEERTIRMVIDLLRKRCDCDDPHERELRVITALAGAAITLNNNNIADAELLQHFLENYFHKHPEKVLPGANYRDYNAEDYLGAHGVDARITHDGPESVQ